MDEHAQREQKFIKLVGGTLTPEGYYALGDYGELFIAWQSLSHLFMVLFEKPQKAYYSPYLIMYLNNHSSLLYMDGLAANYRDLLAQEFSENAEQNLKLLIRRIISYTFEACIDLPVYEFLKGGTHMLTRVSSLNAMEKWSDERKEKLGNPEARDDALLNNVGDDFSLHDILALCTAWRSASSELCDEGYKMLTGQSLAPHQEEKPVKTFSASFERPVMYFLRAGVIDPYYHLPPAGTAFAALADKNAAAGLHYFRQAIPRIPYPLGVAEEHQVLYNRLIARMVDTMEDDGDFFESCEQMIGFSPRSLFMKALIPLYTSRDIPMSWYDSFVSAFLLILARKYAEALEPIDRVMQEHPEFIWAHHWQGVVLSRMGRPQEAQRSFEKVLSVVESSHTLVEIFLLRKKIDSPETPLAALEQNRFSAWPYYLLGTYYHHHARELRKALVNYARAFYRDPFAPFISRIIEETQKLKAAEADSGLAQIRQELKRGDILGGVYEITRVFKGGMGIVYIAYESAINTYYAIKTFQEQFLWDKSIINMFVNEAETWIKLDRHENIVQAKFIRLIDEKPYLFLEYIRGTDLQKILDSRKLTIEETLNYLIQFCNGMSYAHSRLGIVHRDIKPSNCLVSDEGVLKITDFGLVKIFKDRADEELKDKSPRSAGNFRVTATSTFLGTIPYMAPERLLYMESGDIRSDIYSFGVMCYEILTGTMPVDPELLVDNPTHIIDVIPRPPRELNSRIPAELEEIILKCLEKEPENRFSNFQDLRALLIYLYEGLTSSYYQAEQSSHVSSLKDEVSKGNSLLNIGNLEEALQCFERALADPETAREALMGKSMALLRIGRYQDALWCFDRILSREPDNLEVLRSRGMALLELGRFEESLICYDCVLTYDNQDAVSWWKKGIISREMGAYEKALVYLDRSLEYNPRLIDTLDDKGMILVHLNRYRDALKCFDMALELNPVYLKSLLNKAHALMQMQDIEDAMKTFHLALSVQGTNREALMGSAHCLQKLGRRDESLKYYDKVIVLSPLDIEARLNKAKVMRELGAVEESMNILAAVYEQGGQDRELYNLLGIVLKELYYIDNAEKFFHAIHAHGQENEGSLIMLEDIREGKAYLEPFRRSVEEFLQLTGEEVASRLSAAKSGEERISLLNRAFCRGIRDAGISITMSRVLMDQERSTEALVLLNDALQTGAEKEPIEKEIERLNREIQCRKKISGLDVLKRFLPRSSPQAGAFEHHIKGMTLLHESLYQESYQAFKEALRIDSRNAIAWISSALALFRMGRHDRAMECVTRALSLEGGNPEFYACKGAIEHSMGLYSLSRESYEKSVVYNPFGFKSWLCLISKHLEASHLRRARLLAMLALEISGNYLQEHPGDRELPLYRAAFMAVVGRTGEALKTLADLKKVAPPCPEVFSIKAMIYRLVGDYYAGISSCRDGLKLQGNNQVLLLNSGYLNELSGDMDEALACYNKILEIDGGCELALYRKSQVLFKRDKPEDGLLCVDTLVEHNPRSANAWKSKGIFLDAHDKEEEAQWCYKKAVENNPEDYIAAFNLVLLLNRAGKYQEAMALIWKLETFEPYCADLLILKGDTLVYLNSLQEAQDAYDKALLLEPESIRAYLHKAMLVQISGREEEAVEILNRAIEIDPLNISLWSNAAFILTNLLRYDEACEYLSRAITLEQKNHIVHYNMGILFLYRENYPEASRALDSVLYVKPEFFDGWFARGVVAELMGAGDEAINFYEQASRREQKNALVWHHKGNALMKANRLDEAVRAYTQAIKIQNAFEASWLCKARALSLLNREAEAKQCLAHFEEITGKTLQTDEIPPPASYEVKRLFPLKMLEYELPFIDDTYVPFWAE